MNIGPSIIVPFSNGHTSCGTPGPSQPLCGNFGANFAVYLSTGGEIGIPGPWCIECGSGGGSNNGIGEGNTDFSIAFASDTEGGAIGDTNGETNNSDSELPMQADLMAKSLANDAIPDAFGRSRTTLGVAFVRDSEGITRLVSINSGSMERWSSKVLSNLSSTDVWVPSQGEGLHAEQNLVRFATNNGQEILGLGASRYICRMCWAELTQTLDPGVIGTPSRAGWIPSWMVAKQEP